LNKQIFQVPVQFQKASTLSNSVRIVFDTQENISQEQFSILFGMAGMKNVGWLTFSSSQVEPNDLINLPEIKKSDNKTPSQRLYAVIFILWKQDNHGYDTFDSFYNWYMEQIIDKIKGKLL